MDEILVKLWGKSCDFSDFLRHESVCEARPPSLSVLERKGPMSVVSHGVEVANSSF